MVKRIRTISGSMLLLLALCATSIHATTLGNALNFGAIGVNGNVTLAKDASLGNGAVGAHGISLAADASVSGDLVANPQGIRLAKDSTAEDCVTAGAAVHLASGAFCTNIDTSGSGPELGVLSSALTDITTFLSAVAALSPDQTLPAIKVPTNGLFTITDTNAGGLNVISVPAISVGHSGVLRIMGGVSDTAVLVVTGNVNLKSDSVLSPTFSEAQLVIVVNGHVVSAAKDSVLNGTVVAPNAKCTLGPDEASRGAFFCGKGVTLAKDASLATTPSTVDVP
jgi:hypothetical protein